VNEVNTQYIENVIFIMKVIMVQYKSDEGGEHLGQTTIEPLMLSIVRYLLLFAHFLTYKSITDTARRGIEVIGKVYCVALLAFIYIYQSFNVKIIAFVFDGSDFYGMVSCPPKC